MVVVVPNRRRLCSELVNVAWADNHSRPQNVEGNLEEIGEWTAVLLTEDPLPRGIEVNIKCAGTHLQGVVESCSFDDPLGYFVGVRLYPASRWSEEWFTPEHMLGVGRQLRPGQVFPVGIPSGY